MSITVMKQALEALERLVVGSTYEDAIAAEKAITALRTAIAEAEKQEPVAWLSTDSISERYLCFDRPLDSDLVQPLYTTPPAAERKKLAQWMIDRGYATGHGDTVEDLLQELEWQIAENWTRGMVNGVEAEREACAAIARQWDVEHPVSNYGGCIANLIEARGQT